MLRFMLIAVMGLAIHFGSMESASAWTPRSYRSSQPTYRYCPPRYSNAHNYALPGYEYQYYRGRVNNAASYTQMFGI
ncbi:hypothetical protein NG895_08340 [Aeoliella sp. ICT_H6.2]|uniref:Uncharacterized protein n=1 Tax=Aeoliella straminimaris TaxID=2954799 RepID=A0A9X2F929_9BACT|nr:hypothetical protein [Aeoliella straminimaris]MCO6043913.1 hypothetical protein [Aeoliella straminimaris]